MKLLLIALFAFTLTGCETVGQYWDAVKKIVTPTDIPTQPTK